MALLSARHVSNNPVKYLDPSGHCQGTYDSETGEATQDQDCWDFLYDEFCSGGNVAICGHWQERVFGGWGGCIGRSCYLGFGSNYWTIDELRDLRDAIADTIAALDNAGFDGSEILGGVAFKRTREADDSVTFPSWLISLASVRKQSIWHEIAHTISFRNNRMPQDLYYGLGNAMASLLNIDFNQNFCYRQYCSRVYPWIAQSYTGSHPEPFADAFSAWVDMKTTGSTLRAVEPGFSPQWLLMGDVVEFSLVVSFNN